MECGYRVRQFLDRVVVILASTRRVGDSFLEQSRDVLRKVLVGQENRAVRQMDCSVRLKGRGNRCSPIQKPATTKAHDLIQLVARLQVLSEQVG